MQLNRLIIFSFFIILSLGLFGLNYSLISLNIFCHIAPTTLISIWFFNQVKSNLNRLNLIIIFSVFLDSFSYLSMLIAFNYFYGLFSVFTGLILLFVLIYAIRIEGSSFKTKSTNYYLIILIPFTVIFIIYGFLILPVLTEVPLFFTSIYAIVEIIFVSHALIRNKNQKGYYYTAFGSILLIVKDLLYALHYYVLDKEFPIFYSIIYFISPIIYFMIIYGLTPYRKIAKD